MPVLFAPITNPHRSPRAAAPFCFGPFDSNYQRQFEPEPDFSDEYAYQLERLRRARLAEQQRNEARRRAAEQDYINALHAEFDSQQRLRAREQALKEQQQQWKRQQEGRSRRAAQIQAERRRQNQQDHVQYKDATDFILGLLKRQSDPASYEQRPIPNVNAGSSAQHSAPAPTSSARPDARSVNTPGGDLTPAKVKAIVDAHARINSFRTELGDLTSKFAFPNSLSFSEPPTSPHSAPVPLAFTALNKPLLAHEESLLRLLTKLDEIDSIGDEMVKKNRKALVNEVEAELTKVDTFKVQEWEKEVKEVFGEETKDVADVTLQEDERHELPGYDIAASTSADVDGPHEGTPTNAESSTIAVDLPLDTTSNSTALESDAHSDITSVDTPHAAVLETSTPLPSASVGDNIYAELPMEITPLADLEAVNSEINEQGSAAPASIDAVVKEGDKTDSEEDFELV